MPCGSPEHMSQTKVPKVFSQTNPGKLKISVVIVAGTEAKNFYTQSC